MVQWKVYVRDEDDGCFTCVLVSTDEESALRYARRCSSERRMVKVNQEITECIYRDGYTVHYDFEPEEGHRHVLIAPNGIPVSCAIHSTMADAWDEYRSLSKVTP